MQSPSPARLSAFLAVIAVPSMLSLADPCGSDAMASSVLPPPISPTGPSENQPVVPVVSVPAVTIPPIARVDVDLLDLHSGRHQIFSLPEDGELDRAQARQIGRFMRCRRTGRWRRMNSGMLAMLAALAAHFPGHTIEILSAYRAPPYEPSSRHREGRAIDLRVHGIPLREVRDFLWATYPSGVGIGYYPSQNFLHMDHRPGDRIAWTQAHNNGPYNYHPRWARVAPTRVATR
jgi:uncharacterized protein YcbK (DUF882 family)